MNVVYFATACGLLTTTAYMHSRRNADAFRIGLWGAFVLAGSISAILMGPQVSLPACIVLASVAICAATDASSGYIYNVITYPSLIAILAVSLSMGNVTTAAISALGTFLGGMILHAATRRRGFGLGDVKLLTVVAAGLGSAIGAVIAGSFVLGACVVGIGLLLRRLSIGQTVAFAPFIAVATIVAVPAHGFVQ